MPLFRTKGPLCGVLLLTAIIAVAFCPLSHDKGKLQLRGINTATNKTVISYNTDRSIAELLTISKTEEGSYTTARIPVYKNGRLVKTYITDDEASHAPTLFSSFEYSEKGNIRRIVYYLDGLVHGYDSLAYNANGQIIARYFFNEKQDGSSFENNSCQFYTWDNKGNIVTIENMGRVNRKLPFTISSMTTYTYDDHPNAQQHIPALCYLLDITAANLSANNIITETIAVAIGDVRTVNHYSYAYNEDQYPTRITTHYAVSNEMTVTDLEWN